MSMTRHRGALTIAFGVVVLLVGIALGAPIVQDGFSEGATAPAVVERELSAGQWIVFEERSGSGRSITGISITSDTGLSFPAQMIQPSGSAVTAPAEQIETIDGTFVIAAAIDIPRDGTWVLDIASDRPTEVLISPGFNELNQLGTGFIFVGLGLLTTFVGIAVLAVDGIRQSRRGKPGKTISPPISV